MKPSLPLAVKETGVPILTPAALAAWVDLIKHMMAKQRASL